MFLWPKVELLENFDAGNFRNIHFPFDIIADTSIAVASEMVEELDLTDQDVSAIAAMIDSEIRSLIPDWAPRETWAESDAPGIHSGEGVVSSEIKNSGSPVTVEPALSGSFISERTPSGRKYWFNPTKEVGDDAPLLHGPSKFSCNPAVGEGGPLGESPESPARQCDNGENAGGEDDIEERLKTGPSELGSNRVSREHEEDLSAGTKEVLVPEDNHGSSANDGSVNKVIEKLEHLLLEQERELQELRRKHCEAVLEVLDGLSKEAREAVLTSCRRRAPAHEVWSSIQR